MKMRTVSRIIAWLLIGLIFHGCSILTFSGSTTTNQAVEAADRYFNQENWRKAITAYEDYLVQYPDDPNARIKLGRSHLALGKTTEASDQFKHVIENQTTFPHEAYYWAGRASQMLDEFSEAERFYRSYVHTGDNGISTKVNFFLKQVGAAHKAGVAKSRYLIENVGNRINSSLDEFQPIFSPNVDQRFYYSIHVPSISLHPTITQDLKSSMRMAEIRQGVWTHLGPLDPELSGDQEYQLVEFSKDGQRVYYTATGEDEPNTIYQKSFSSGQEESAVMSWNHPVFDPTLGDRDVFFINDSAFLFSSNRLEGQGGYDIFVTYKRLGEWVVQNLGSTINSPYDEIFPFLSNDGRELYFSSNSVKSIGGYDIFFATFDDDMETWSEPQNMLPPLNSGLNEVGFRLAHDGSQAFMASDRIGGYGGMDIYQVHFDEPKRSQIGVSHPRYFYQVRAYRSFHSEQNFSDSLTEKPVYPLPVIAYGDRPVVITPQLRQELDKVLEYCKLYPHTRLLLRVFTDREVRDQFTLYRPILALQKVLDYLETGGLTPYRYQLRMYGNQYPHSSSRLNQDRAIIVPAGLSNQRLEFDLLNTENLPVQFGVSVLQADEEDDLSPYQEWQLRTQNLYFRIKLVESDQLIKGSEYYQVEDLMVLISDQEKHFTYYGGIYPDLEQAKESRLRYHAKGFLDAEIVAFLGSSKVSDDQINSTLIEEYPQLKEYIIYQK